MEKRTYIELFAIAASLSLSICSCHQHNDAEEGHHHSHEIEEHGHSDHSKSDEFELHDELAERFGVKLDTVRVGNFSESFRATGQIMPSANNYAVVSSPRAGVVSFAGNLNLGSSVTRGTRIATIDASQVSGGDSNRQAKAVLDAAEKELARIEPLYRQRLVTATEYNAAVAAVASARAAYSPGAANGAALSPISGVVTSIDVANGQYVNAGDAIATVSSDVNLTLKIDIPRRYANKVPGIIDAIIEIPYSDTTIDVRDAGGKRISASAMPAYQDNSGYIPVYFSIPRQAELIPGGSFTAYLQGSQSREAICLPLTALSEQQGAYYVFEQVHPEIFIKRKVTIGQNNGRQVTITSGLKPGAVVVTDGVITLRLAETGTVVPEGHSHNH